MREVLMMLNNYFNDMFISMVFFAALFVYVAVKYLSSRKDDAGGLLLHLYERMRTLFIATFVIATAGALLRIAEGSELREMAAKGFKDTLEVKYGLLLAILVLSLWIWICARRGIGRYRRDSKTA